MNNWRAKPSRGSLIGIVLTLLAVFFTTALFWRTWLAATAVEIVETIRTDDEVLENVPDFITVEAGANLMTLLIGLVACASLLLVFFLAYQTWRIFALRYSLDRNAITIELGDRKQIIPLANIESIASAASIFGQVRSKVYSKETDRPKTYPRQSPTVAANEEVIIQEAVINDAEPEQTSEVLEEEVVEADYKEIESQPEQVPEQAPEQTPEQAPKIKSIDSVNYQIKANPFLSWPGFYFNKAQVSSLGSVQFYSTQPFIKTLLIFTAQNTYAISPANPQQFLTEYKLRRRLGAKEAVEETVVKGFFLSHPLWQDRLGRLLILGAVLLNLALFFYLLLRYDMLPSEPRIHFNKLGQVDRIGERGELMVLPFIGLLGVLGNCTIGAILHPRERIPAYLLYASAILVQILTAVALLVILFVSGYFRAGN